MKYPLLILALALSGCGGTVVQDRPTIVKIPVMVPCVAGERPTLVESLKAKHPGWKDYSLKQKTELMVAAGLRHKSYGEELQAVTGACQ